MGGIYRGPGGTGDATADAASEASLIKTLAVEVQADADAAEAARAAAVTAQIAAELAETNAETAEANAETAETNAETAQAAAASSASAAATSATNAANSATAAQTAETNAETAETNAETAETNAAASASAASTSATNASNSASSASTSATNASNSATAAATSATNASNSATAAASSASAASTSATNAANSATAASGSATSAASSASTATTQAGLASTSASNAATSESNAASSASAASTSATNAQTAETNAETAQAAAESARDATLAAYDSFDDRYLGAKIADPVLDNDGNALAAGELYFNTVSQTMKVYTGTIWVDAYADGNTFLAKANNLSDLTNDATARTNLGLAIGTDVQAYSAQLQSYATNGVAMRNRIINGAMVIDQRNAGASVTPTNGSFSLDRWTFSLSQTSKLTTQQNAGSVTPPVGFSNYLGLTSSSAYSVTSSDYFNVMQTIEAFNTSDLGWGTANAQTVTLSFWVRSSLTGTFGGSLRTYNGYNTSYPFTYTITSANTWEQKSITIAGPTTGTWNSSGNSGSIVVGFGLGAGSTFNGTAGTWATGNFVSATGATSVVGTSGATFYITGVQLEKGSTATSFDYRPYGTELALCQRYYQAYYGTAGLLLFGRSYSAGAGQSFPLAIPIKVSFRASPTGTITGTWVTTNATQPIVNSTTTESVGVVFNSSAGGDCFTYPNSTSVGVTFSAEL